MYVVGVDGCRGGWLAARLEPETLNLSFSVHRSFPELLAAFAGAGAVAVDIPIGLIESAPRECDRSAREHLESRRSTVFPAPDPRLVTAGSFEEANARARSLGCAQISQQAAAILAKVLDVNWSMTPADQDRVFEVHPEVGFWKLNGERPVLSKKATVDGFAERRSLLVQVLGDRVPNRAEVLTMKLPAEPDDFLDAIVAGLIARKWVQGTAQRLPADPQIDRRGLRAEIVY